MADDNAWHTALPTSSSVSDQPAVVRPDTLSIGSTAISMDLLTPQLLQFLQSAQAAPGTSATTPDPKVLDGLLPQLTKSFADATASDAPTGFPNIGGSSVSTNSVIPQNSFIISTGGGLPTDVQNNQHNYILISPIGATAAAAAAAATGAVPTSLPQSGNATNAARNLLLLNDPTSSAVDGAQTTFQLATDLADRLKEAAAASGGGADLKDLVSSSTTLQDTMIDSDSNRPTRPSSTDSSLYDGGSGRGKLMQTSGRSSGGGGSGEPMTLQNRLEQKRARNRDAARRCRERKIRLIETLEKKVTQLSDTNKLLKRELEQTQGEVESLRQFVEQHFRAPAAGGCSVPLQG